MLPHAESVPFVDQLDWTRARPLRVPCGLSQLAAGFDEHAIDRFDLWLKTTLRVPFQGRLRFPSIGPVAEIFVDGESKLLTKSFFHAHEIPLALGEGAHELVVCLRSPARFLAEKRPRPRWKTKLVESQNLRFLRAPLLGRIPSWSPAGAPRGILVMPRLIAAGALDLGDVQLSATLSGDHGHVTLALPQDLRATQGELHVGEHRASLSHGRAELIIPNASRWWPHTHGPQTRYPASLVLDGSAHALGAIGFRSVEVPDPQRFGLRHNGIDVFCRGAVFVPSLHDDPAADRRALEALRDAGGNMVRVGGTMRYEDARFFDDCDELGLLVWQDFMFANMDYPIEDAAFAAELAAELDEQFALWARHPSLAVLCGGSEVAQQAAMVGQPPERWYGPLFERVLSERCATSAPGVPYVLGSPSSPIGEDATLPFQPDAGVAHYYGVGAYLRPFDDARRADIAFASECLALANVPEPHAVETLFEDLPPATHTPRWKAGVPRDNGAGWDFEDVRDHYHSLLFETSIVDDRYADAEGYLERARITSVEVLRRAYAEWRRTGSRTHGGLVWFLRDLVPGAGWGLLDSAGRAKAPLLALRNEWAPTALLLTDEGTNGLRLHVAHEGAAARTLALRVSLHRNDGTLVAEAQRAIVAAPRSTRALDVESLFGAFRDIGWAYRFGPRAHEILLATLHDGDTLVSSAAHLPTLAALSRSPIDPRLQVKGTRIDARSAQLEVSAERVALYVVPRGQHFTADAGYFHLRPGQSRNVRLHADADGIAFKAELFALGAAPVRVTIS